jgi:K+-sensing histidine kinase KdpD
MADAATTPEKDPILSHGAHEIRTPVTVILGYIRMLTSERMGAVTESQRKALGEMQKTAAKLSALADEMSELSVLVAGATKFNRAPVDLGALIQDGVATLPPLPDREVSVRVINEAPGAAVDADPLKLRNAMTWIITAHRRELVTSDELCVLVHRITQDGRPTLQVTVAGADRVDELRRVPASGLVTFEEVRGGVGYTLSIARRIIAALGAQLWSPAESPKAAAVLFFPEAQTA